MPFPVACYPKMSRPGNGGGPSFVGPLDDYTAGLKAALLPFRGFSAYEAAGWRIRDAGNGDAEQDVLFDAIGNPIPPSLVGNGFGRQHYNQIGSNNFGNSVASSQPLWSASSINGYPSLVYDGTDDYIVSANSLSFASGLTLYTVLRFDVDAAWQTFWCVSGGINTRIRKTSSDALQFTTLTNDVTGTTPLGTSSQIITCQLTGSMKKAWLNNAIEINTADTSVASSGNYLIGLDGFDVWPMNGPIAAVLAYDAVHNDTTRQAIQTILADKFGITLA